MSDLITRDLDVLVKVLRDNTLSINVGVLGDKNTRKDQGSNAEIGAKHEFGQDGMPVRSFLRYPIINFLQKFLEKNSKNLFTKMTMIDMVAGKTMEPILNKIAATSEIVVQEAFASGGFGEWKPSNMNNKATKLTLVETTQLRDSITSEVK